MTDNRDERLGAIIAEFLQAAERGEAADREALVAAHPELADDLRSFFANHERMRKVGAGEIDPTLPPRQQELTKPGVLEPTIAAKTGNSTAAAVGEHVRYFGDYELLEEIARGGMGVVYKARQVNLNRVVALKMILAGQLAGETDVKRFRAEAEAAAKLDHPNIVPIFEVGEHHGRHYFSMGYVEGRSLADRVAEGPLPPEEAAALVKTLAKAIEYAHGKGVIHRDLKPANVLLASSDRIHAIPIETSVRARQKPAEAGHYEPKITDFGLAKKLDDDSGLTATGQILGTPAYMPPEQAAGKVNEITETADVYSLGAILYCLLVGRPPFQTASPVDTLMQVLRQDPVSPRQLNPKLPRDLETICLKCLEKDRERRYHSAQELVDELERFLTGRPIQARPVSRFTRTLRWCRRNPAAAVALAALAALFLTTMVGAIWFNAARKEAVRLQGVAMQERDQAERQRREVERQKGLVQAQRDAAERQRLLALERLDRSQRVVYASQTMQAQREWNAGDYGTARETLELTQPDLRGWEYDYLIEQFNRNHRTLSGHTNIIGCVAVCPAGKHIASSSMDRTVRIWDAKTEKQLHSFETAGSVKPLMFSSDGRQLFASIHVWDLNSRQARRWVENSDDVWSRDRALMASAKNPYGAPGPGVCLVRHAPTGNILHTFKGHEHRILPLAFHPDATLLASGDEGGVIKIWSIETGQEVRTIQAHGKYVNRIVFRADGKNFASSSADQTIKVFETASGEQRQRLTTRNPDIHAMAFRPGAEQLAAGSKKTLKLWDLATGQEIASLVGHDADISDLAFTPDGKEIVTCSYDKTLKIWKAVGINQPRKLEGKVGRCDTFLFLPDGNRVILGGGAYTDDGEPGDVTIWDVHTGKRLKFQKNYGRLVAVSPDGSRVASAEFSGSMRMWNAQTGEKQFDFLNGRKGIHSLAFHPDGEHLVSGSFDGSLRIWGAESGHVIEGMQGPSTGVHFVAYSPDGNTIVSAGGSHQSNAAELFLWDAQSGQRQHTLTGHASTVLYAAFHPNGKTMATASRDKLIKIWNLKTGQELATLKGHTHWVTKVFFSPDGSRLFSNGFDGTTRVWDPQSSSELLTLENFGGTAALSPDGRMLVGIGSDGFFHVLNIPKAKED